MKILFLNIYDEVTDGGGAEVVLWDQINGLARAGHECVLLATSRNSGLKKTRRSGIDIWRVGIRNLYWPSVKQRPATLKRILWHMIDSYNPFMQGYLRKVLEVEQPDVVSIQNLSGWSVAAWSTIHRLGIPIVQTLHDNYLICPKSTMFKNGRNCGSQCLSCRVVRLPHRRFSSQISAVVGVSQFILDRHIALGYFKDVPLRTVIHNVREPTVLGLDKIRLKCEMRPEIRIGYIGRLDPTKGIEKLLDAFERLNIANTELWIAGTGNADYEALLQKRITVNRVRFLGRVIPNEFYSQVDVVVVPSLLHDTLPTVIIEAMAFGKVVIGSRRGGISEMISNGENGILFEPKSPGELYEALRKIVGDSSLRTSIGAAALVSAGTFIDMNRWIDNYSTIYEKVAGSASSSRGEAL